MVSIPLTLMIFTGSVIAGIIGALLGLGGGIIIIPLLTLAFNIDIRYAIGASVVAVIATSSGAASTYVKDRITNIRVGMFLVIATTTGAVAGAFLVGLINPRVLYFIFAIVLGFSSLMLFRRRNVELPEKVEPHPLAFKLQLCGSYYDQALNQQVEYAPAGIYAGLGIMFIAGIISGILGIGNGVFTVVAMDMLMKMPMKVSTATSNFMIGVTVAASAGIYFSRGYINPAIAAPVALGVFLGAILGPRLMVRLKNTTMRKVFVPVLIYVALQMFIKGIQG